MRDVVKMGIVLMLFCSASAGALSYVFMFTKPHIEKNARMELEASRREVLPASGAGKAVEITARGYAGGIAMIVGIDRSNRISGVKILRHTETPGLGANITDPRFLGQFAGKSIKDPIDTGKDIDAITGATISSKGVCAGVREALEKVK